jgi:hypothetical protein
MDIGDVFGMVVGLVVLALAIVLAVQILRLPGAVIRIAEDVREIKNKLRLRD